MPGYFYVWQLEDEDEDWDDDEDEDADEDWDDDEDEDEYEGPGMIVDSVEDLLEAVREWASSPQGAFMVEWRTEEDEDEDSLD